MGAAAALVTGVVHARARDHAALASGQRYACPMHPEVKSNAPGSCPICSMALVPIRDREVPPAARDMAGGGAPTARAESRMVALPVRAPAWIDSGGRGRALFYRDDLVGMSAKQAARFYEGSSRSVPLYAHLSTEEQSAVDSSTVYVRFDLDPPAAGREAPSRAHAVGALWLDSQARKVLVVPTSAVLHHSGGPYVLVSVAGGEGEHERVEPVKRAIEVGRVLDSGYVGALSGRQEGATVVLSGLSEGERVVTGYAFFADAERRLREARGTMEEAMR